MNRVIKKSRGIFIFAAIETYFYFKFRPKDLEMFFMIWGFISLVLLLYNIFNVKYDGPMISVGSSSQSSTQSMGSFLEKIYATDKNKTRNGGGILDPINLLYLFFVIANVIGYIFVMPK